jgi:hypothetical protein
MMVVILKQAEALRMSKGGKPHRLIKAEQQTEGPLLGEEKKAYLKKSGCSG